MEKANSRKVHIFAHRGYSAAYPENTMAAFKAAEQLHVDGIEFDVQLSKDNIPVIIHDSTLERTTTGYGEVRACTFQQLQELSAGKWFSNYFQVEKIPSLEQLLNWAKGTTLLLNIELKPRPIDRALLCDAVLQLVRKYQLEDRVIISSFDHKLIQHISSKKPHIESAIIVASSLVNPANYLKTVGVTSLHYDYQMMVTNDVVDLLDEGIKVRPYTINSEKEMKVCFQNEYSGFFTDNPKLAIEVRNAIH
ncbi:glycerophosphodiester phosphodiesterase family protein [Anaerobacillus sp. MEB173]|uniref:glycerophosphodiester phosphodiesterase family protein n=1 Tax=Anaerobacillus sp. MEB173 TaxID=3383345 RepID=UPI003F8FD9D8